MTPYAPDVRAPLHPPAVWEDAASLLAGPDRPAVLWRLGLDPDGELVEVASRSGGPIGRPAPGRAGMVQEHLRGPCEHQPVRRCDLHLHLHGSVRPAALLAHLARCEDVPHWDWYESEFEAVHGVVPPTRHLVERYRRGDASVVDEFASWAVVTDADAGEFARFQVKANLRWVASGDRSDALEREAVHHLRSLRRDLDRQGIAHAEVRTSPTGPPALLRALAAGDGGATVQAVATLPRVDPLPAWEQVREALDGPHGEHVVAIDFSGVEEGHPPRELAAVLAAVHRANEEHPERAVAVLAHVGESFGDKSVESAVRWVQEVAEMGVHRLGHAIALALDPDALGEHVRTEPVCERRDQIAHDLRHAHALAAAGVRVDREALAAEAAELEGCAPEERITVAYDARRLAELRARQDVAMSRIRALGTVIEVCPTSNRRIGGIARPEHHPLRRFLDAGIPVVIGTDDPGIFDVTLDGELDEAERLVGGADIRPHLLETAWRSRAGLLAGRTR